jgi:hypothetical protein
MLISIIVLVISLAALGSAVYLVYLFLNKQNDALLKSAQLELKKQRQEYFLPSRLEAYQRSILLMERLHPNSLVMRLHNPGLPARALQADILKNIREEFDHNVVQQMFISKKAWKMMVNSKEDLVKLINTAGNLMGPTSTGMELSAKILEMVSQIEVLPSEVTVDYLKDEFQQMM